MDATSTKPPVSLSHVGFPTATCDLRGQPVGEQQLSSQESKLLFAMLTEVGLLPIDSFQRLIVSLGDISYVVTRDESYVYMVKQQRDAPVVSKTTSAAISSDAAAAAP